MSKFDPQSARNANRGEPLDEDGGIFNAPPGTWRVRPTVLLLITRPRDGAVLVQQADRATDEPASYRLPGGGLEFGETVEACARREAREELGAELSHAQFLSPVEFFFHTPGEPHHELGFIHAAGFADASLYDQPEFRWIDGDDREARAKWVPQHELLAAASDHPPRLRPRTLASLLQNIAANPEFCRGIWAGFRDDSPRIRVATRCLFRRPADGAWLVIEAFDEHKNERFFIVPGGGMQFGETSEQAIRREIVEELGSDITDLHHITTLENHFVHRGTRGHELMFIFTGTLADQHLYARKEISLIDGGESLIASWLASSSFRSVERPDLPPLYPEGLLAIIRDLEALQCVDMPRACPISTSDANGTDNQ